MTTPARISYLRSLTKDQKPPGSSQAEIVRQVPKSESPPTTGPVQEPIPSATNSDYALPTTHSSVVDEDFREELQKTLHTQLVKYASAAEIERLPTGLKRETLMRATEALLEREMPHLSYAMRREILDDLLDEVLGFGPLEKLLRDPNISDIVINGANQVYVEQHGRLERSAIRFRDDEHLLGIIRRIVSMVGRRVDDSSPIVDARLPDGSRVNAIIPPLALKGPMLSIRRFGAHRLNIEDLITLKALAPEMSEFLQSAVRGKLNITVSGGTGSGKTTLLNALSAFIPNGERIITIEDTAELRLQQEHVGSLESRPANVEGKGEVTIRDLLKNALRMRPNRIIVGECRSAEALDMLQAMNTGHAGSMTTLHANSPRDALSRLEIMVMMGGLDLPLRAIRQQIANSINLIIQVSRVAGGGRRIVSITEVTGMEGEVITLQEIFRYRQTGVDTLGQAKGRFEVMGLRPLCEARFLESGIALPSDFFRPRDLMEA